MAVEQGSTETSTARPWLLARLFKKAEAAPAPSMPQAPDEPIDTPVVIRPVSLPPKRLAAVREASPQVELSWRALIHRCREMAKANCVFAVDGEGLVLAHEGDFGRAEVARIAAHLSRSFDFLDKLPEVGEETESICAMYSGGNWLTAVRIAPRPGVVVTIGIIGPFTLIRKDRQRLRNTFYKLFEPEFWEAGPA